LYHQINRRRNKDLTLINEIYRFKNITIKIDAVLKYTQSDSTTVNNAKLTISNGKNRKVLQLRGYAGC
jgi:hypothetical protein